MSLSLKLFLFFPPVPLDIHFAFLTHCQGGDGGGGSSRHLVDKGRAYPTVTYGLLAVNSFVRLQARRLAYRSDHDEHADDSDGDDSIWYQAGIDKL